MCSQHCNNTEGSHFCDCYVGYELQDDGLTCNGEHVYATAVQYCCAAVILSAMLFSCTNI